jgi:hypothetical protein
MSSDMFSGNGEIAMYDHAYFVFVAASSMPVPT